MKKINRINILLPLVLLLVGVFAVLLTVSFNYKTAISQVREDALEIGMRLAHRSGQMFMVSTTKFHKEFSEAKTDEVREKVRSDWTRTIIAVDQAVINDFGEGQARVRLLGDTKITGNKPLGGSDTALKIPFESDVLKRFASGEADPVILDDEEAGVLRIAMPLMSNMHPGCAECHRIPVTKKELLGGLAVYVPVAKKFAEASKHALIEGAILAAIFLGAILLVYLLIRHRVLKPIQELKVASADLSEGSGDLTLRVPVKRDDEIGDLANNFNRFIEKLQMIFQEVAGISSGLSSASEQASSASANTASFMDDQKLQTHTVITAIAEMEASATEIANSAIQTSETMQQVNSEVGQGINQITEAGATLTGLAQTLQDAKSVVHRLEQDGNGIGGILDVIRNIAEQTNLLALNAAIEAARAGEQGRGFAVVADEVRTLAQRTQDSISEIEEMIQRLQGAAGEAVTVMSEGHSRGEETLQQSQQAESSLNAVMESFAAISESNVRNATAAKQQSATVSEVHQNVSQIAALSDQTSTEAHQASKVSQDLSELSQKLRQLVDTFRA